MKRYLFIRMLRDFMAMLIKNERAKQRLLRKDPELYARLYGSQTPGY